ncbi:MAG: DUF420 domain-containing protein [Spirochaetota bacterium]|nr:DUF420 domain-containing protein [Spirochaetota bacterium]
MSYTDLPLLNASLNGLSLALIIMAFVFIKRNNEKLHKLMMMSAIGSSTLFLISYVIYHYLKTLNASLITKYPEVGIMTTVYYVVLRTHSILAMVLVVLVVIAVRRALKDEREGHKKVVKWAFPIWLYVSLTGIVIYLMLYPFNPGNPG